MEEWCQMNCDFINKIKDEFVEEVEGYMIRVKDGFASEEGCGGVFEAVQFLTQDIPDMPKAPCNSPTNLVSMIGELKELKASAKEQRKRLKAFEDRLPIGDAVHSTVSQMVGDNPGCANRDPDLDGCEPIGVLFVGSSSAKCPSKLQRTDVALLSEELVLVTGFTYDGGCYLKSRIYLYLVEEMDHDLQRQDIEGKVHHLAVIQEPQVALHSEDTKKLMLIHATHSHILIQGTIQLSKNYMSMIAVNAQSLAFGYRDDFYGIDIVNLSGHVLRCVSSSKVLRTTIMPCNIHIFPGGKELVCTDFLRITTVDLDSGRETVCNRDCQVQWPMVVAGTKSGHILVWDRKKRSLSLLAKDGTWLKDLWFERKNFSGREDQIALKMLCDHCVLLTQNDIYVLKMEYESLPKEERNQANQSMPMCPLSPSKSSVQSQRHSLAKLENTSSKNQHSYRKLESVMLLSESFLPN